MNRFSKFCAIFSLFLVMVLIIGHVWTIPIESQATLETIDFDYNEDLMENEYYDFAGEYGQIFSISSSQGLRSVKIYEAVYDESNPNLFSRGELLKEVTSIQPNEKVRIRAEFTDMGSNVWVEYERMDFSIVSFMAADSGRDGSFVKAGLTNEMTTMSYIYYFFN